ncbi:dimethylamine monooxygenase subunit DmmA family protein [Stutzerimonas kirkiae]|uniref:Uncharacterized protein n=1 Tax=Stutzerimonas kirkiae TaxID=2211392 RepID=A0A4V2KD78_9GAMM|nr:dimethylamine monooxygenase subunit DmmA family protein [Stutzerimonas kirkiae]TBU97837.1 hypothetical protein DNJ96_08280 [Stutzerimonas kirkiae]TBV04811.1 hypothetical protein DNJ95_03840 [Stutzerimonas kirkiae]TBV11949.1 hypothetical protein DNK08_00980 [Stutzerimonas kirkiae]TBV15043.1 hypothetical protein DNK01_08085 [Stutzerimonas kirkiae]
MTAQSTDIMFSKPRYATEVVAHPASRRLLVAQDASSAAPLLALPAPKLLLSLGGELPDGIEQECLPNPEALYLRLQLLLEQAQAGTRLYVVGDETFLWHVHRLARQAGLLGDEIELFKQGERRRLYCVHCATFQDIAEVGETCCSGCGLKLLVREHFSARLGAYMGVCLDPDRPFGEVRA